MVQVEAATAAVPLSRERIAVEALAMLDTEGYATFSLRRLAARLSVRAPSLYNHVDSLDDVVNLVHANLNAEIDTSLLDRGNWREAFHDFAHSYRNAYRKHPSAAVLIVRKQNEDSALEVYETIARKLLQIGVPAAMTLPLMANLDYLVLGSTVEAFAPAFPTVARLRKLGHPLLADLLKGAKPMHVDDRGFEVGLEWWLNALGRVSSTQVAPCEIDGE